MKRETLPVTPAVVRWARERAGFSLEEARQTYKRIEAWETGAAFPSYAQLEDMADKFKVPIAVFFFLRRRMYPISETPAPCRSMNLSNCRRAYGSYCARQNPFSSI
jgi:transcriptional regulator with XRE-family HTH domain